MTTGAGFRCEGERSSDGVAVITVWGDLDIASADHLRNCLADVRREGELEHLVFDLSDVPFIDSSGIGVLVGAQRLSDRPVFIVAPEGPVRRALWLSTLYKVFAIRDSKADVLAELRRQRTEQSAKLR